MIVIIGAGLAGLSTAYHLKGVPHRIFEKEREVGGLCRSYQKNGFTFDFTGHLLHFRQPAIRALVESLLPDQLERHSRRSYIFSHQRYTEYPFQVNTHGLPPEVVRECLLGFITTLMKPCTKKSREGASFKEWIVDSLGEGIARHFMVPFNEKLWQVPLEELTSDWVSWLVPKPDLKDVVNGALGIKDKAFGYNPSFLYPSQGGIKVLPEAFLSGVAPPTCNTELVEVDTQRRRAVFHRAQHGQQVQDYEALVSTIPLPELVRRCPDLPRSVHEAAAKLRWVSVYNVNLGVAREGVSDKHWIYFPESEYPFYRAGFPMNFSPALGPSGCSSLYVEISHRPTDTTPFDKLIELVCQGMERAGIFRRHEDLVVVDVKDIQYAYVLFDTQRARAVSHILEELSTRSIHSVGRYGLWEHTSMEDAIAQGRKIAEQLRARMAA